MLNSSMYAKTGDLSGKAKHSHAPLCHTWVSAVASCGVLKSWSREEDCCRSVYQLTIPFDNCKGMGWIITILVPALLLKAFVFYFRISCFILLDQSLSYPCTRNVPRLGSASLPHGCVQQWHSTQVSAVWELVVPQLSSDSLNLSREPTPVSCVFNLSVEPESQRQLPVSVPVSQTQTMLQLLLGSSRSPLPGWCLRCSSDSATLLALHF